VTPPKEKGPAAGAVKPVKSIRFSPPEKPPIPILAALAEPTASKTNEHKIFFIIDPFIEHFYILSKK
jgi:hypothetical protein